MPAAGELTVPGTSRAPVRARRVTQSRFRRALRVPLRHYGALVLVGALLVRFHGGWLPPVTIFGHFLHVALALCVPLLLLELLRRRWWAAGTNALGVVVFLVLFGGRLAGSPTSSGSPGSPGSPGAPAAGEVQGAPLRVLTLNLGRREEITDRVTGFLAEMDADVVALQELVHAQADRLRDDLAALYPHQRLEPDDAYAGMGLLSKRPLRDYTLHPLTAPHPAQSALLTHEGRDLRLVNVHPKAWIAFFGRLSRQAADIETAVDIATSGGPAVLLGDFNSTDRTWVHRHVRAAGLIDSWHEAGEGFGFTFPGFLEYHHLPCPPILRIDHVFHTEELVATEIEVAPAAGADHLPLLCTLRWRDPVPAPVPAPAPTAPPTPPGPAPD